MENFCIVDEGDLGAIPDWFFEKYLKMRPDLNALGIADLRDMLSTGELTMQMMSDSIKEINAKNSAQ